MSQALLIYLIPAFVICFFYCRRIHGREHRAREAREAARQAGLGEPASLHPIIDPVKCVGCGSCAEACPEGNVLGVIEGKGQLVNPSHCIGHGACMTACPVDAITLVFGTQKRGVDIPLVKPNFETNVPGVFIAGELGGMGLIGNAIEQGRQALQAIARLNGLGKPDQLDVVIIGGGPAGFSASLAAMEAGLRFVTLEQETLGGTVAHFPRGKIVMTRPVTLPLVGKVKMTETTKEALLEFWRDIEKKTGLKINYGERVEKIHKQDGGFTVTTPQGEYRSRAVLLAIGRRGTPRKLGVSGENQTKVVYRLIDPEQYRGQHVLVVGGGDSALEAALSIADQPETRVTLSYRGKAFSRAKEKNRNHVERARSAGRLAVALNSQVVEIGPKTASIEHDGRRSDIANDAVIVCAGGILPTGFLRDIGVKVETKHGAA